MWPAWPLSQRTVRCPPRASTAGLSSGLGLRHYPVSAASRRDCSLLEWRHPETHEIHWRLERRRSAFTIVGYVWSKSLFRKERTR
jgi:hypothetical protein